MTSPISTFNQIAPPPAVVCVSTHIDSSLWTGNDFTWDGASWDRADTLGTATSTLGPPAGGWNVNTFRPTEMHIGINIDKSSGMSFPTSILIVARDTDGLPLGTTTIVVVNTGAYTDDITLNWGSSAAGAGIGEIDFTPDLYSDGPRITCIEYVGSSAPSSYDLEILAGHLYNVNLYTEFQSRFGVTPSASDTINILIDSPVQIGSTLSSSPSLRTGSWPSGVVPNVTVETTDILGAGANGVGGTGGGQGGTAFLVESAINLTYTNGAFKGGGGAGAGTDSIFSKSGGGLPPLCSAGPILYASGGGGGAGDVPGTGYIVPSSAAAVRYNGSSGNSVTGGAGGNPYSDPCQPPNGTTSTTPCIGGDGGDLGAAGGDGSDVTVPGSTDNVGGSGGYSIDGYSLVTVIGIPGTLVGATNG